MLVYEKKIKSPIRILIEDEIINQQKSLIIEEKQKLADEVIK